MPDYLSIAIEAARQAGEIQREGLQKPISVRAETRYDIKLQTDVDCEERIRTILLDAFPNHAIMAEEGGGAIAADVPTWIVDPLDGTVNYAHRLPHFCTSIALHMEGRPVLGVIYDPLLDEMFTAEEGSGAYCNETRISVSAIAQLTEAMMAIGFAKSVETMTRMLGEMQQMAQAVQKVRILGAAALDMAYVACGRLDAFVEFGLRDWDIAAGAVLIREAGGRVQLTETPRQTWNVRADNGRLL